MVLVVILVKRLLGPVLDDLQFIDAALHGFNLVIGFSVIADAGIRIRIRRIPYQVRHNPLILSAGYQRISADLRILFDNEGCLAVFSRLCRRGNSCAAASDDNHIPGILDRILRLMYNRILLKLVFICYTGLFGCRIDGFPDRPARKGCSGNGINTGTVGIDNVRNHDVVGGRSDMIRLVAVRNLNFLYVRLRKSNADRHITVVAGGRSRVGSGSKGKLCACIRRIRAARRLIKAGLKGFLHCGR